MAKRKLSYDNISSTHPVLCPDGKYRWVYDVSMLKTPTILLEVFWVLGVSFGAVWLFVLFIQACSGGLDLSGVWSITRGFLLLTALFLLLGCVAYFFVSWKYGWHYSILFISANTVPKPAKAETMKNALATIVLILALLPLTATAAKCPVVKIQTERLPDLTIPRAGHSLFYTAGGELTVAGGHTTGFVPTPTAEYFDGSQWHQLPMTYTHDNGTAVPMKTGKVLLCGGHSDPIGMGQTYLVECYDPATRTFTGFTTLYQRRALANAVELDSGRVLIAGNHYHKDGIELFDGQKFFNPVRHVAVERAAPFLFHTSDGDVTIVGSFDNRFRLHGSDTVDRVYGAPFSVPLLREWHALQIDRSTNSDLSSIGGNSYLLPLRNAAGRRAIAVVRDTTFTLLPTDCDIPLVNCSGDSITYEAPIICDRRAHRAYVMGYTRKDHFLLLAVDYARTPAALTLLDAGVNHDIGHPTPLLTPDGDLIVAGGINCTYDNFSPLATVWLIHTGTPAPAAAGNSQPSARQTWLYIIIFIGVALLAAFLWRKTHSRKTLPRPLPIGRGANISSTEKTDSMPIDSSPNREEAGEGLQGMRLLLQRIRQLMDQEQLYLRSDLKVQDVAVRLGTNSSYISECINSGCGQTFTQFINGYRVRHAQELLRRQPDMKSVTVATASGFSTEASFFRNFKAVTGLTPREWLTQTEGSVDTEKEE